MHFERSLRRTIYAPWKDQYIDYAKLKSLLKDEGSDAGSSKGSVDDHDDWTEDDEGRFVEELVNVQLEKVHAFQHDTIESLRERTSRCEAKLDPIIVAGKSQDPATTDDASSSIKVPESAQGALQDILKDLDGITKEMNELEKFSRINYTGFMKATKKHDRRRGHAYRVRPLMQVRLAALPFNKEDYSPLLFRLSTMYSFCRQNIEGKAKGISFSDSTLATDEFTSHKFWVHHDNLLELKTVILRRLPCLVYNPQTSKIAQAGQNDPSVTSIYFDNPDFSLYNAKLDHSSSASSLRMRWYGHLSDNPEIFVEKKTVSDDDVSREEKFTTKAKYIQRFLKDNYKMDREVEKLKDRYGDDSDQVHNFEKQVDDIQDFIKENKLQPVVRANYTRSAFQIPGDARVRITLDTDLAVIREDSLDPERPCRDPDDWHRRDIDDGQLEYPFEKINKGEINRFPFALLEIRLKGNKKYEWTNDLMSSHLVKPAPRFSKFVHGVAQLFDDYVNAFPFWLSEVDTDIRRDPHDAFEEEQQRRLKVAEDEIAVGSLLKGGFSPAYKAAARSPASSPQVVPKSKGGNVRATPEMTRASVDMGVSHKAGRNATDAEVDSDEDGIIARRTGTLRSLLPLTKYGRRHGHQKLPPGVSEPSFWIKDEGPVKVEAKVWLANQRTYIKWQHVGILLSTLSLGLFNAAGKDNNIARALGIVYTVIGVLTALWGYGIYIYRSQLIEKRSGKDFDHPLGPIVVCIGLIVALCLNFGFKYQAVMQERQHGSKSGAEAVYQPMGL